MAIKPQSANRWTWLLVSGLLCFNLFLWPGIVAAQDKAGDAPAAAKSDVEAESTKSDVQSSAEEAHAAEGAHGAHDPYDLSHANAGPNLTSPADIRFDMAIYSAVVFFLLLAILYKFAWGPIAHGLEHRENSIVERIENARISAEKAAEQVRLYEARLAAAADEARQIVAQAHRDAEAAREKIVAEAQASAQKERERAVADINAAKNDALRQIAQQSVDTAIQLAGNIVRHEIRPEEHERLISESLGNFSKLN